MVSVSLTSDLFQVFSLVGWFVGCALHACSSFFEIFFVVKCGLFVVVVD